MKITDESWQFSARDPDHKREMLAFAQSCGVKAAPAMWGFAEDDATFLNYWNERVGLGTLLVRINQDRKTVLINEAVFKQLCIEYQQEHAAPETFEVHPHPASEIE